jgi:GldM C-terminal domain
LLFVAAYVHLGQTTHDPIVRLGTLNGGEISADTFIGFNGLNAALGSETCTVTSFTMTYVAHKADAVEVRNHAQDYNEKALKLVAMAKPSDYYYFDDVMVKCPGDTEEREVNALVFKIK